MTAALRKSKAAANEVELCGVAATLDLSGALFLADRGILVVVRPAPGEGVELRPARADAAALRHARNAAARSPRCWGVSGRGRWWRSAIPSTTSTGRTGSRPRRRRRSGTLQAGRRWVWITGNHDRALPPSIGGEVRAELRLGPLTFRHEPLPGATGEIAGHLHPAGKVVLRGRGVRRRCFVTDGQRMILPAFGAYAGGLNVCDAAFKPLFPKGLTAHLIGDGRLFAIGKAMLCRD